jgi:dTDP-4-amino-4,6-dideoxygalactose transaminase
MRRISFTCSDVPPKAKELVLEVLESGQFSPGPKVRAFEEKLEVLHDAKHAIFVNSGTDALRLSLLAMKEKFEWPDGASVAVPALTFVATVNVILQAHLKPLFVDVSMNDYTFNPWNLERLYECSPYGLKDLVAILPVQLFGQDCEPAVYKLAEKRGLKVLEDSCETIGNPLKGDVGCHSTYMAHHVTTGVGGFALTNDDDLNLLIRSYANHGRDVSYLPGYQSLPGSKELLKSRFRYVREGYSSRATEFEAALGLAQLEEPLEAMLFKRRNVAAELIRKLKVFDDLKLPATCLPQFSTYMMFPMLLKDGDKYDLCLHLEDAGIETRDMMPITTQPIFKDYFTPTTPGFSVAKEVNEKGFYIPCHEGMTEGDIYHVREAFESYFARSSGRLDRTANAR